MLSFVSPVPMYCSRLLSINKDVLTYLLKYMKIKLRKNGQAGYFADELCCRVSTTPTVCRSTTTKPPAVHRRLDLLATTLYCTVYRLDFDRRLMAS